MNPAADQRRLFFAVRPDAATRARLDEALGALQHPAGRAARLRWLDPLDWHVTLRFLGPVDASAIPDCEALLAAGRTPLTIRLTRIEPFPDAARPLVIAATGAPEGRAAGLVARLEQRCRALGLPADPRPWRPHLTVARVRGRRPIDWPVTELYAAFDADAIELVESVATAAPPRYRTLARRSLHRPR